MPPISCCESDLNKGSRSGHQSSVCKKAVAGGTVVGKQEIHKGRRLCLFVYSLSLSNLFIFLDHRLRNGNNDIVAGSIMQLTRLDACIATVLT